MATTHSDKAERALDAQANYERIMKKIEPFIPQPKKGKPPRPEEWRRDEDMPADFKGRYWTEHRRS